jgi:hypothetical protein
MYESVVAVLVAVVVRFRMVGVAVIGFIEVRFAVV